MSEFTAAVVVPTNRPDRIQKFVEAWEPQFNRENVNLIVVEDAPEPTVELPSWVGHLSWRNMREGIRDEYPNPQIVTFERLLLREGIGVAVSCIPTQSGGVRDYGILVAAQGGRPDFIVSLDDDCLPLDGVDFLAEHWKALSQPGVMPGWTSSTPYLTGAEGQANLFPRGVPFGIRDATMPIALNHGLWANIPDLDAPSQLLHPTVRLPRDIQHRVVAKGYYMPVCAMNLAFKTALAPLLYFPKLSDGMKRWDDIWCGVFLKRLLDTYKLAVLTGAPSIWHDRASNVWNNMRQEIGGMEINETLWQRVDAVKLSGTDMLSDYVTLVETACAEWPQLAEMVAHVRAWGKLWEGWDFSPLWGKA